MIGLINYWTVMFCKSLAIVHEYTKIGNYTVTVTKLLRRVLFLPRCKILHFVKKEAVAKDLTMHKVT